MYIELKLQLIWGHTWYDNGRKIKNHKVTKIAEEEIPNWLVKRKRTGLLLIIAFWKKLQHASGPAEYINLISRAVFVMNCFF